MVGPATTVEHVRRMHTFFGRGRQWRVAHGAGGRPAVVGRTQQPPVDAFLQFALNSVIVTSCPPGLRARNAESPCDESDLPRIRNCQSWARPCNAGATCMHAQYTTLHCRSQIPHQVEAVAAAQVAQHVARSVVLAADGACGVGGPAGIQQRLHQLLLLHHVADVHLASPQLCLRRSTLDSRA